MTDIFKITSKQLLAVEGKDECNFFKAFLESENISNVQIIDAGGKDQFKVKFRSILNLDGFSEVYTLGFVRDAEKKKPKSAFDSICATLKNADLPFPTDIANPVIKKNGLGVGIYIMPNNIDKGMLEDLCLKSINAKPVFKCVDQYIKCVLEQDKKIHLSKARIQVYLACKKPIVNSLGLAALKEYWNFEDHCFDEIRGFLHNLFLED
jgi:uncharacterized protein DUF3226